MIFNFKKYTFLFLFLNSLIFSDECYDFKGQHFFASYNECDIDALTNINSLTEAMKHAIEKSNATILDSSSYTFPGNGVTMVFLLSESHASIHTYPEHNSCFVDLFTCGNTCSYEEFHESLCSYLNPRHVNQKVLIRHENIDEAHETN